MQALATGFFAASKKPVLARILLGSIASGLSVQWFWTGLGKQSYLQLSLPATPSISSPSPSFHGRITTPANLPARDVPARDQPHVPPHQQSWMGEEKEGTHLQGRAEPEQWRTAVSSKTFTQLRTSQWPQSQCREWSLLLVLAQMSPPWNPSELEDRLW